MKKINVLLLAIIFIAFIGCEKEELSPVDTRSSHLSVSENNSDNSTVKKKINNNKSAYTFLDISTGFTGYDPNQVPTFENPGNPCPSWNVRSVGSTNYLDAMVSTGLNQWAGTPPFVIDSAYIRATGNGIAGGVARWLAPSLTSLNHIGPFAPGAYTYSRNFNLDCGEILSVLLSINDLMGDDEIASISINGNILPAPNPTILWSGFGTPKFSYFADITQYCTSSTNTLKVVVLNYNTTFTSFYLSGGIHQSIDKTACDDFQFEF
tara:strand:+ start:2318 stop:3112 length:795 start_codon:yes stop_codon:yes gene_type:complete